ncbi:MAG: hypothetical protein DWI00_09690 [Planctomycetota bacterium]|nr:MAG: hypothetical protein DWI00_09690 [Planctomycetota bacterium]
MVRAQWRTIMFTLGKAALLIGRRAARGGKFINSEHIRESMVIWRFLRFLKSKGSVARERFSRFQQVIMLSLFDWGNHQEQTDSPHRCSRQLSVINGSH